MFEDLYDAISLLWSSRWPAVEGEITAVEVERIQGRRSKDRFRLAIAYKFWIGEDGPYTGEGLWEPSRSRSEERATVAKEKFHVGQRLPVRYRPDDPAVNGLDRTVWQGL
ncbi:MAG TPA: DUF3592 domain-containing protein [Candidatus Binatia bacterium]|nr:DUF3592 domain-containing protein [Candidatus Binatia bacterium]